MLLLSQTNQNRFQCFILWSSIKKHIAKIFRKRENTSTEKSTYWLTFDSSVGKWMIMKMIILLEYFDKHFSRYYLQAISHTISFCFLLSFFLTVINYLSRSFLFVFNLFLLSSLFIVDLIDRFCIFYKGILLEPTSLFSL